MQAIILAAGMGKRLKELTKENTKCMVKVNGVPLIDRLLGQLDKYNLSSIIIVIGYQGAKLKKHIDYLAINTPITFIENNIYDKTNNIYSLSLAKQYLCKEDTLLFESDIIFEDSVLESLLMDERDTLALVDKYEPWMDGTCVRLDDKDNIIDFVSGKNFDFNHTEEWYKTVNIYKFSKTFSETHYVPFLEAYLKALGENEYYEQVLKVLSALDVSGISGKRLDGQKWYEIDDIQDLDIAEVLFCDNDIKVQKTMKRYGGYWRYPYLLDFCYLVNPYYPSQKLKDEIKASFDRLINEYPSGMSVNSLLAGKMFDISSENIVVGNGASELIKSLSEQLRGKIGYIRPTFEEYPNRYSSNEMVYFTADNNDFSYSEEDIISFFDKVDIKCLILINPDNPSGNYIEHAGILKLLNWSKEKGISIIIDESFSDFSDEQRIELIDKQLLDCYPQLYVLKSISKSYGVPGLRLGVLASGNKLAIKNIKKEIPIWNINSFAEFYMQVAGKYKEEYRFSLDKLKEERKRFRDLLSEIEYLRVVPSQANYFMVELLGEYKVADLTQYLLINDNILIKDLHTKLENKNYFRVAIRDEDDNNRLIKSLNNFFGRG